MLGPQFGSFGATAADLSVAFVSQAAVDAGDDHMTTRRRRVPVPAPATSARRTSSSTPASATSTSTRGPGMVSFDGETVYSEPAESVSLSRLYFL